MILQTNFVGTYNVIRLTAPLFYNNKQDENGLGGVIINTSGIEADSGGLGQVVSSAAAGAIKSMTRPLATEFSEQGIRVVNVSPAFIKTPFYDFLPKKEEENISNDVILGSKKFGEPDDFARLVQSIVTNPYINAVTIEISGGADSTI